ncbi:MAG: hypothetical protein R3264_05275, partial [Anaerolineae bacterium]|nr:hypothetical protein [Anaerolineae bacterium]
MTKQQPDSQVSTAFPKTGEVHEIFPGLTYRPETEVDTITWSNRYIPRNNSLYLGFIIGLVIFTPLALFLTLRLIDDINRVQNNVPVPTADLVIAVFFVLISWVGFAGLTYYLIRLSWTETIRISNDDITLQY